MRLPVSITPLEVSTSSGVGARPGGLSHSETLDVAPCAAADAPPLGISFRLDSPGKRFEPVEVPSDESNLVVRALAALRQRTGCPTGARIALTKRIPAGAGLGGGSSDAAAALLAANEAWGLGLARSGLAEVASSLGSDVPFFLDGRPAVCSGRGETITPVERTARLHAVVVTPQQELRDASVRGPDIEARRPVDDSPERHATGIRRPDEGRPDR